MHLPITSYPLGAWTLIIKSLDARTSLQKVDAVLKDAQAISANAKDASADLGALRGEVDASLRKVQGLMTDINRKWPFARDTEIVLP